MTERGKCVVPCKVLRKVMKDWAKQNNLLESQKGNDPIWTTELAKRAGMNARHITTIVNGPTENVTFDVADKIVTKGMGDPLLWHRRPLSRYYGPIETSWKEQRLCLQPGTIWKVTISGGRKVVTVRILRIIHGVAYCEELENEKLHKFSTRSMIAGYSTYRCIGSDEQSIAA